MAGLSTGWGVEPWQPFGESQNKSQGQMMHRGILDREEGLLKQVFVWKTECKELKFVEVKD